MYFLIIAVALTPLGLMLFYANLWAWKLHIYEANPLWRWTIIRRKIPLHAVLAIASPWIVAYIAVMLLEQGVPILAFLLFAILACFLTFATWNDYTVVSSYKKCANCPSFDRCPNFTVLPEGCVVPPVRNRVKVYQSIRELKKKGEL